MKFKMRLDIFFISFFYLYYFSRKISPDLFIFLNQSTRMFNRESVYFPDSGMVAQNSSFLYFILYPLTLIPNSLANKIFLAINLLLILLIHKIIVVYSKSKDNELFNRFVLLTILFHFSTRSILNNGQVGMIVNFATLIIWILLEKNRIIFTFTAGFSLFMIFELKPYLTLSLIIFLLISKKFKIFLSFLLIEVFYQLFILFFWPQASIFEYLKRIIYRQGKTSLESDQSSLFVILIRETGFSAVASYLLSTFAMIIILIILIRFMKIKSIFTYMFITGSSVLLSPYAHRQDYLMISLGLVYVLFLSLNNLIKTNKYQRALNILIFISFFQYGGSNILGYLFILIGFIYLNSGLKYRKVEKYTATLLLAFLNLLVYLVYSSESWSVAQRFWSTLVLIFSYAHFTLGFLKLNSIVDK